VPAAKSALINQTGKSKIPQWFHFFALQISPLEVDRTPKKSSSKNRVGKVPAAGTRKRFDK
jgi:hypothetical protein